MEEKVDFINLPKIQGKLKVELMDGVTGKVKDVANGTNFISKGYDIMARNYMRTLFTGGRGKNPLSYSSLTNLFRSIVLTDYDGTPEPNEEWCIKGKIIGEGNSTSVQVGTTTRGTLNLTESSTSDELVRMVFDFGMDSALGTIKSVYSAPIDLPFTYGNGNGFNAGSTTRGASVYNNKVYILVANGNQVREYSLTGKLLRSRNLPADYGRAIAIYNDIVYLNYGVGAIHQIPFSDLFDGSKTPTHFVNGYAYGMSIDVKTGYLYFSGGNSNLNRIKLPSNTVEHVDTVNYTANGFHVYDGVLLANNNSNSYGLQIRDISEGRTINNFDKTYFKVNGGGGKIIVLENSSVNGYGSNHISPLITIGSRSLLDKPVIKTNTSTMRVTYDFHLPPFDEF